MIQHDCYDCRHLRLRGVQLSGYEHFICMIDRCYRNPYGFDSRPCEHWAKCRMARKEKKKRIREREAKAKKELARRLKEPRPTPKEFDDLLPF